MAAPQLPLIVEPDQIRAYTGNQPLLIVDLGDQNAYQEQHIPGAVHLPFSSIVRAEPPAMGLLPTEEALSEALSAIGLTAEHHVIAYDHEGSGRASRLLWTLDVLGHPHFSLLDGGIQAWLHAGMPVESGSTAPTPSNYQARIANPAALADKDYILSNLDNPGVVVLDTRTAGEFAGTDKRAARGGHIPGAVNLDWSHTKDPDRQGRLRPTMDLKARLEALGVTPDKEVITHCQTHHRSAHTYVMLKHLGYTQVRGYAGSWSEWGNDPALPIEQ